MEPAWTRDGRELTFVRPTGNDRDPGGPIVRMMAVEIGSGPDPKPSAPRELFTAVMNGTRHLRSHDVTADGSRFLVVNRMPVISPPGQLNVMVNWFEELRRLAAQTGKP